MLRYNENRMGTLTIEQNGQEFEIQIRQGNCLAVFIHVSRCEDGYTHMLYSFFADVQHLKNIIKGSGEPFSDSVKRIQLNMRYKECYTMLRQLAKFYTVECYYE